MTPEVFATLERLVDLRRQREALAVARIRNGLASLAEQSAAAKHAAAATQLPGGPSSAGSFAALASLQRWEAGRQKVLAAEAAELAEALPAAECKLRHARATVQAMDVLGERVARAAARRQARRQDLAAAAEAANRPV